MKYTIPGAPIPWARTGRQGDKYYDTQSGYKMAIGTNLRFQHKDNDLYEGPLHISIIFYLKHQKKKGYHHCRPDLDNMIKFYLDAMNSVLYADDSQVAKITAEKVYSTENKTEITIEELK